MEPWEIQVRCVYYWLRDVRVVVCGLPAAFIGSGKTPNWEQHFGEAITVRPTADRVGSVTGDEPADPKR